MKTTSDKRNRILRRTALGALVLITAMAQFVPWLPVVYGARAFPLLVLVAAIAYYDQAASAVVYGALVGALWDIASPRGTYHAIFLAIAAFFCAMGVRYFFNRNKVSKVLIPVALTAVYVFLRWALDTLARPDITFAQNTTMLLRETLPSLGYTLLFAPLMFTLVSLIVRRTSRRQQRVLAE
ncbi:MAG: rod shape-determining protein MreD [Oscillospiraceae bacterium]|nr:rod shape-determining protein MreD [Oscillospiraceae bacterium]